MCTAGVNELLWRAPPTDAAARARRWRFFTGQKGGGAAANLTSSSILRSGASSYTLRGDVVHLTIADDYAHLGSKVVAMLAHAVAHVRMR